MPPPSLRRRPQCRPQAADGFQPQLGAPGRARPPLSRRWKTLRRAPIRPAGSQVAPEPVAAAQDAVPLAATPEASLHEDTGLDFLEPSGTLSLDRKMAVPGSNVSCVLDERDLPENTRGPRGAQVWSPYHCDTGSVQHPPPRTSGPPRETPRHGKAPCTRGPPPCWPRPHAAHAQVAPAALTALDIISLFLLFTCSTKYIILTLEGKFRGRIHQKGSCKESFVGRENAGSRGGARGGVQAGTAF